MLRICGAPTVCIAGCLFRVAGIQRIPRLLLQPPLEVLPSPEDLVVQPALGDLDVLIGFLHHHNYVAATAVSDHQDGFAPSSGCPPAARAGSQKLRPNTAWPSRGSGCRGGKGRRLGSGAAEGEAGEDANSHEDCFPCSAYSNSPFEFLCAAGKQHNTEALGRSPDYSLEKHRGVNEADCTARDSPIVFCGADFTGPL